jgi:hypothetical protein
MQCCFLEESGIVWKMALFRAVTFFLQVGNLNWKIGRLIAPVDRM